MRLRVKEFVTRKALLLVKQSRLGIAVVADADDLASDVAEAVQEPVLKWISKRGPKAHRLMLLFVAPPELHAGIERWLMRQCQGDYQLGKVIDRLGDVPVTLSDEQGQPIKEFVLNTIRELTDQQKPERKKKSIDAAK